MFSIKRVCKVFSMVVLFFAFVITASAQNTGKLKTKINPGRTGIFVDGKYLGPAANFKMARTYTLSAGEHEVLLTEPRYKDHTTKVTIEAGKTFELKFAMEALPTPQGPFGRLRIVTGSLDKFTPIYINGKYMGHIDEFSNPEQGLLIKAGDYDVKIGDKVEKASIKENQVTVLKP
jgi:hypothetical protein